MPDDEWLAEEILIRLTNIETIVTKAYEKIYSNYGNCECCTEASEMLQELVEDKEK